MSFGGSITCETRTVLNPFTAVSYLTAAILFWVGWKLTKKIVTDWLRVVLRAGLVAIAFAPALLVDPGGGAYVIPASLAAVLDGILYGYIGYSGADPLCKLCRLSPTHFNASCLVHGMRCWWSVHETAREHMLEPNALGNSDSSENKEGKSLLQVRLLELLREGLWLRWILATALGGAGGGIALQVGWGKGTTSLAHSTWDTGSRNWPSAIPGSGTSSPPLWQADTNHYSVDTHLAWQVASQAAWQAPLHLSRWFYCLWSH